MSWVWIQLRKVFQGQSANWNFSGQPVPKKGTTISKGDFIFQPLIFRGYIFSKEIMKSQSSAKKKNTSLKGVTLPLPCESGMIHLGQQQKGGCHRSSLKAWSDIPSSNWSAMSATYVRFIHKTWTKFQVKNPGEDCFLGVFLWKCWTNFQISKENYNNISMCRFWQQLNDHPKNLTGDWWLCVCISNFARTSKKNSITNY